MNSGQVSVAVAPVRSFANPDGTSVSTTGSSPVAIIVIQPDVTELDNITYEIGAMVKSRMTRLLVVCDMHGPDLREIIGPRISQMNVHDGRSVMREAILAELNRLSRDIAKRLDQTWPSKA